LRPSSEPIFNVPRSVTLLLALLILVQAVRDFILSDEQFEQLLLFFSFIPARYDRGFDPLPGGLAADMWTFVTYAFLHGSWLHLGLNGVWLLAFGSPVAWRLGPLRFWLFFAITAAAGAATHLLTHAGEVEPVIGASAGISGFMAAAVRFAFQRGAPIGLLRGGEVYRTPAAPLLVALRDRRVVVFLVAWFGGNLLFAFTSVPFAGEGQVVAWEAHIGGFLAGLFAFPLFDPIVARPAGGSV